MFKFLKKKKYKIVAQANISMLGILFEDLKSGEDCDVDYKYWKTNLEELKSALEYVPQYKKEYDLYNNAFNYFKEKHDLP